MHHKSKTQSFQDPDHTGPTNISDVTDLEEIRAAAMQCRACPLYLSATQTVFGEGKSDAEVMFVGEQPGDQEDVAGRPFVGPAGKVLDQALAEAGISRQKCYVTNAVKHFKWKPAGKRRIHEKPGAREIEACRPWLDAEIRAISSKILVCLGATAVRSVFNQQLPVLKNRGRWMSSPFCPETLVTVHPSSILRGSDPELQRLAYQDLVADLLKVAQRLADSRPA